MFENVLAAPEDVRKRRLKCGNPKLASLVLCYPSAVHLLALAGFAKVDLNGEPWLVLNYTGDSALAAAVDDSLARGSEGAS